jgi:hypothetical protein
LIVFGFDDDIKSHSSNGSLSGGAGLGRTWSTYKDKVMFFDNNYGAYWYDFYGAETSSDLGWFASISADAEASLLLGVRNNGGNYGPEAFAGKYTFKNGSIGVDAFLKAEFFYQKSVGTHWTVHEIGILGSLDAIPNAVTIQGSIGDGNLNFFGKQKPTRDRSWSDIITNWIGF